MNILGATSGDTGSAAIYGLKNKKGINIFILHPKGKVSPIQKLQMTTVTDPNVFNLAIRGTFDDGQSIVKQIFTDLEFKAQHALASINSINWARLLAQTVYYFYAWAKVYHDTAAEEVCFSVPTGNFGDIFAGYIAKKMGLPIRQLIIATNENNILTRFVRQGDYSLGPVRETISPSMDIQMASNFERYLYFVYDENAAKVLEAMDKLKVTQRLSFAPEEIEKNQSGFYLPFPSINRKPSPPFGTSIKSPDTSLTHILQLGLKRAATVSRKMFLLYASPPPIHLNSVRQSILPSAETRTVLPVFKGLRKNRSDVLKSTPSRKWSRLSLRNTLFRYQKENTKNKKPPFEGVFVFHGLKKD